jgi:hypothetical protein
MPTDLDLVSMSPTFTELATLSLKIRCKNPSLGLVFGVCAALSRDFIADIERYSTASKIKDWRGKYHGAYIVDVDKHPVFTSEDFTRLLFYVRNSAPHSAEPSFTVVLEPDTPPSKVAPDTGIPHLQMAQFFIAISALYEIGEGKNIPDDALDGDDVLSTAIKILPDGEVKPGTKWTCLQLKPLASLPERCGAEKEQLDQMHIANIFGPTRVRPTNAVVI